MKLSSEAISDRRRIYLVGIGSGGVLALRLACDDPELFAGVAVVGAALPRDAQASCKINRPIAFMMINGTADPKVPFAGGQASLTDFKQPVLSSDDTIAPFAAAAGCAPGQKTQTQTPHRDPKAPTRATLIRYTSCKAPVEFYRIEGGGHTIPTRASIRRRGADANNALGPQNHDISAGRVIASFFQRRAG